MNDRTKSAFGIFIIIVSFILVSYFVQNNMDDLRRFIGFSYFGMVFYIIILILETVIAPVSAVPLVPLASNLWGWFLTAILSIIGWTLGAMITFFIAREYGVPLIKKFISLEKIEKYEKMIPKGNIFWSIVFLRMAVPVDLLSYALGLFSRINFKTYTFATFLGVMPFAFAFAYLGTLPLTYQIVSFVIGMEIILIGYVMRLLYKTREKKRKNQKRSEHERK